MVEDELQREVMRGHPGLGQHWAVALLSAWDTGGSDMRRQPWGMWVRQAAARGRISLVPARWDWQRTTGRFFCSFHPCLFAADHHKKYDDICNLSP